MCNESVSLPEFEIVDKSLFGSSTGTKDVETQSSMEAIQSGILSSQAAWRIGLWLLRTGFQHLKCTSTHVDLIHVCFQLILQISNF